MKPLTMREFTSMGGKASAAKRTPEQYEAIGKKVKQTLIERYGPDYFKNIRLKKKFKTP